MFSSLTARETFVADANLVSQTQVLLLKQMFPSLATEETFQLVPSAAPERCFLALRMRCSLLAMFSSLAK